MSLETVRLSQPARDRLVRLKRTTGITQWNVLCRWALALSLKDPSTPLVKDVVTDSNVEMTWKTFAGHHGDIYLALLKQRCIADGIPLTEENVAQTLTVHLHRGIGYLGGHRELTTIEGLISSVTS
ncbi:DNA sulfur modification protein DndE [Streptomyces mirabilis]|uniref:DNA sulfur modification protein DndE n=1 Tax=Streptomyces mirabilis TaxID=68239 RepID=UPI002E1E586F